MTVILSSLIRPDQQHPVIAATQSAPAQSASGPPASAQSVLARPQLGEFAMVLAQTNTARSTPAGPGGRTQSAALAQAPIIAAVAGQASDDGSADPDAAAEDDVQTAQASFGNGIRDGSDGVPVVLAPPAPQSLPVAVPDGAAFGDTPPPPVVSGEAETRPWQVTGDRAAGIERDAWQVSGPVMRGAAQPVPGISATNGPGGARYDVSTGTAESRLAAMTAAGLPGVPVPVPVLVPVSVSVPAPEHAVTDTRVAETALVRPGRSMPWIGPEQAVGIPVRTPGADSRHSAVVALPVDRAPSPAARNDDATPMAPVPGHARHIAVLPQEGVGLSGAALARPDAHPVRQVLSAGMHPARETAPTGQAAGRSFAAGIGLPSQTRADTVADTGQGPRPPLSGSVVAGMSALGPQAVTSAQPLPPDNQPGTAARDPAGSVRSLDPLPIRTVTAGSPHVSHGVALPAAGPDAVPHLNDQSPPFHSQRQTFYVGPEPVAGDVGRPDPQKARPFPTVPVAVTLAPAGAASADRPTPDADPSAPGRSDPERLVVHPAGQHLAQDLAAPRQAATMSPVQARLELPRHAAAASQTLLAAQGPVDRPRTAANQVLGALRLDRYHADPVRSDAGHAVRDRSGQYSEMTSGRSAVARQPVPATTYPPPTLQGPPPGNHPAALPAGPAPGVAPGPESSYGLMSGAEQVPTVTRLAEGATPAQHAHRSEGALAHGTAQQIARAAALIRTTPDQGTELRLDPQELGQVRLTLHVADNAILLQVQAERPETADLIRRHIAELVQELRSQGYAEVNVSVGQGGGERSSKGRHLADHDGTNTLDAASAAASAAELTRVPATHRPAGSTATGGLDLRL